MRKGDYPLDRTSMFSSYADAVLYANGGKDSRGLSGVSYVGQIITVYENGKVDVYKIGESRNLENISPIIIGDMPNSAVLEGGNNQVISDGGVALGKDNFVGLKGWYYKAIQFDKTNNVTFLYLSKTQQVPVIVEQASEVEQEKNIDFTLILNDVVSVVNDSKYDNKYKISTDEIATYGRIGIKSIDSNIPFPFDKVKTDEELSNSIFDPEDYSIYCLLKPDAGIVDMGQDSFVSGYNNKATNGKATAFGYNNHAYGKFSFVEGRNNEAAYAAHAEGRDNVASGEQSHVEGRNTIASGNCSHAEGRNTVSSGVNSHAEGEGIIVGDVVSLSVGAYGRSSHVEGIATTTGEYNEQTGIWSKGDAAHAEGNNTIASGNHSHAEGSGTQAIGWQSHSEGYNTVAKGNRSHAEGSGTETYNLAEHAQGSFNKSTKSTDKSKATQFSIGIGTSDTDRKNAFEVKQNGDIYINGITLPLATLLSTADTDADVESVWNEIIK